jgi:2-methylcitrate dehydratase PrpD
MDVARRLADFAVSLRHEDVPTEVVGKAKDLVLNTIGVQLAAAALPWSRIVSEFGKTQGGPKESMIVSEGWRTGAANATYVNGCFAHGFELDDNHHGSAIKGGSVVVPSALAVAEREHRSGEELLTALVAGYEVMVRVAQAARSGMKARGNHPTGTVGGIGAAVVAGKLLGLDLTGMTNAIAIAAGVSGGYAEVPTKGRGDLKRTFPAAAAFHGVRSAMLARTGMTAPATTLDPGYGFARSFDVTAEALARVLPGLGSTWELLECHFKIYAQDGYIQPMTEALEAIQRERHLDHPRIASVRVGTSKRAYEEIIGPIREPKTLTDAQFSANFSVALYLVTGGAGFDEYSEQNLSDPRITDLAARVAVEVDDRIEREFERRAPRGARVTVTLVSGEVIEHYVDDLRHLTAEELRTKFVHLASRAMPPTEADLLAGDILHLDEVGDMAEFTARLVRRPAGIGREQV